MPRVLQNSSGFVYYVSMNGITGSALPDPSLIAGAVARIKGHTELPICVGFGVKTPNMPASSVHLPMALSSARPSSTRLR